MQRRPKRSSAAGFGLLDLLIAMTLMTIAFGGVSMALASSMSLRQANQETGRALRAALSICEDLRARTPRQAWLSYNADPADDIAGPGTGPGPSFDVPGLRALPGDADGSVGRVSFPGNGLELLETTVDRDFGMPRDLDLDAAIDGTDKGETCRLVPVRVRVEWLGPKGRQSIQIVTTIIR
jgi:type II secretory pathway pseudopilin PulG